MANHNPMVKMLDNVDKEKFFKDLMRELESDDWKNTKRKLEEIIIKTYMEYDNLTSYEDFIGKQSEIKVLKRLFIWIDIKTGVGRFHWDIHYIQHPVN